jgi:TP901 family phage tail tape measure protein
MAKLKEMASKAGREMGLSLGEGSSAGLDKLKESAISTERVVSDANRKMIVSSQQYQAQIIKVAEVEKARGAESAAYAAAMARQTDMQMKATAAARDHSDATIAAAAASSKFAGAKDEAAKSTVSAASVLNGVGAGSFLAFGAAMAVSADKAANFQQSQERLVSVTGETAAGMKVVSDGILNLAGNVGYSAGELSTAMLGVEKAGYRGADAVGVLTSAAQLAKVENADVGEVINGLTTSMSDFGFKASQSADVASKLNVAIGDSKVPMGEFTGALHSAEPLAASLKISYEDLLATMSQGTRSGAGADQVAENIRNALNALSGASVPAKNAMAQLGISADDVSQHLGQRGLSGTMQYLADTIKAKMDPNNLIDTGAFKQNAQELDNMTASLAAMSPEARNLAEGLRNGSVDAIAFRKGLAGTSGEDTQRLRDFQKWSNDLNDFSKRFKNGQSTLETYNQALRDVTGTVAGQSIALQVTGEHADATNAEIAKLQKTTADSEGKVAGFNETQTTLKQKLDEAKAGFGAAATEMGEVFIPVLTNVAGALKNTAEFLAAHKTLVQDAVIAVGAFGIAWAGVKVALAVGNTFTAIGTGIDLVIAKLAALRGVSATTATAIEADAAAEATAERGVGEAAAGAGKLIAGAAVAAYAFYETGKQIYDDATKNDAKLPGQGTPSDPTGAKGDQDRYTGGTTYGAGGQGMGFKPNDHSAPANSTVDRRGRIWGSAGETIPYNTADRRGRIPGSAGNEVAPAGVTPTPGAPGALPVATAPMGADPGVAGSGVGDPGGSAGSAGAKPPKGDKNDPIWIAPKDSADFKNSPEDHGVTGSSILAGGFDFSPKSIGTFFTALITDLALGNPIGKTLADKQKRGDSASNPLYVTNADVDRAQKTLDDAVRNNGPDSAEAKSAAGKLTATRAAVGTTGGYYDAQTGAFSARASTGGDAALLAGVPAGKYSQDASRDLFKGLSDCSSSVGDLVNRIDGQKSGTGGNLTTGNAASWLPAHGFVPNPTGANVPGAFNVGYNGEHMQATLPGGTNWNYGSDAAAAKRGISGGGAFDPTGGGTGAFTSHYYRPVSAGGSVPDYAANTNPALNDPASTGGDGSILGSLRNDFLGGGGEGPVFKRSPLPSPGGGGGGGGGGQIGPFPVPGSVYNARVPGANLADAAVKAAPNAAPGSNLSPTSSKPAPGLGNSVANTPRSWGSGKGATSSIGSSIMAAAGPMAAMAPGSAQAAQLLDRTIGYAGQMGGIAVEGLMQSLIPTGGGGGIGDPSKSVLGKLAGGIAGAHKSAPNSAGTTAAPGPKADDKAQQKRGGDQTHIGGDQNNGTVVQGDMHVHTTDAKSFASDQPQNIYPTATR